MVTSVRTSDSLAGIGGALTAGLSAYACTRRSEAHARQLPSFLVVGPPRTGTSWIHEVLRPRATLPAPTKETRFFDVHFSRGLDWYLSHFPGASGDRLAGEVAPTYFASSRARDRIAALLPHVKLVFVFRHPVHRLISLYRLKRAYGMFAWSLEEALERDPELIASSRYATHLRAWQGRFPAENISVNFFEELSGNPQAFLAHLCDFLGMARFELQPAQLKQVYSTGEMSEPRNYFATRAATAMADWCKARRLDHVVASAKESRLFRWLIGGGPPFPEASAETKGRISALLSREIEEMEIILERDLSHWKYPLREGRKGP